MSGTNGASCGGMEASEREEEERAGGNLVDNRRPVKQEAAAGSINKLTRGGVNLDEAAGRAVGRDYWCREREGGGQKQEQRRVQTHVCRGKGVGGWVADNMIARGNVALLFSICLPSVYMCACLCTIYTHLQIYSIYTPHTRARAAAGDAVARLYFDHGGIQLLRYSDCL
jgi:hypothetical protein